MKSDVAEERSQWFLRGGAQQLMDHTLPPCFSDLSHKRFLKSALMREGQWKCKKKKKAFQVMRTDASN